MPYSSRCRYSTVTEQNFVGFSVVSKYLASTLVQGRIREQHRSSTIGHSSVQLTGRVWTASSFPRCGDDRWEVVEIKKLGGYALSKVSTQHPLCLFSLRGFDTACFFGCPAYCLSRHRTRDPGKLIDPSPFSKLSTFIQSFPLSCCVLYDSRSMRVQGGNRSHAAAI